MHTMKQSKSHPSRTELIRFARKQTGRHRKHIESCDTCRTFVELYRMLSGNPEQTLEIPSAEALAAWQAIPHTLSERRQSSPSHGTVASDSWQRCPAAAVREYPVGQVRYLTWEFGEFRLELVAHREHNGWHLTARAYRDLDVLTECSLKVGRRHLLPGSQGFFMWTNPRPPGRLTLKTIDQTIELEPVSW